MAESAELRYIGLKWENIKWIARYLDLMSLRRLLAILTSFGKKLKTSQSRQKSYADKRRRELEFNVGDQVFLKVSPWKGVMRFGKKGKLSPRYVGPYEIVERIGVAAYRLALPPELSKLHDVFHVSMLRRYFKDPSHILTSPPIELDETLSFEELPVQILDRQVRQLRSKSIPMVKVLWRSSAIEEMTWETEESMRKQYPELFNHGT